MNYLLEDAPSYVRRATHLAFLFTITAMLWFVIWALSHPALFD